MGWPQAGLQPIMQTCIQAAAEAHHVSVQLVPFDALLQESLLLSCLHRGALVHAHKVQVVQLALLDAAPLCQLMAGRHQQN